jgi:TRAP-type mannitol/chloroaromatic compound transport system substrate-binding protein
MNVTGKAAVFALVSAAFAFSNSAFAEEKLSMATSWSGGPLLEWAQKFAERVNVMTDGEVLIEVFPAGTLGSPLKVTETVSNGVAEVGHSFMAYEYGSDKTTVLFSGRPGGLTAEVAQHWLSQGGGRELWREYRLETAEIIGLPCAYLPREAGMFSTKRIETLQDFDGLKLRTAGAWAEIAGGLGVSTVVIPSGEVYQALERGVVDAVEWSTLSLNRSTGFQNVAPYIILPGFHQSMVVAECSFNKKVWGRLSVRNRRMIEMAANLEAHRIYEWLGHHDALAYQSLNDAGVEFVTVDDEVLDKVDELVREWEDENAARLGGWFARVLELQREYEALWGNAHVYRDMKPLR